MSAVTVPAVTTVPDRAGRVETQGVEYIPEAERDSRPANVAAVFLGGNLALSVIVFGWLPITFGLGFASAITASLAGLALGTLITAPLALLGTRTGTNNPVSSGAHFGVRGRIVGSALTLAFALAFVAISVWTGGDALVASAARLLGTPAGDGALAVGYALITLAIAGVALLGHATVVAAQKLLVPVVGVLLLAGVPAFAGSFDAGYAGGDYLLGGFGSTWMLAFVVAAAGPISYAPVLGDYTRRISRERHGDRSVVGAAALGVFGGLAVATLFGAFTAVTFADPGESYVLDLVAGAPGWYVLPILVIGLAGSVGQGALNLYAHRARHRLAGPAAAARAGDRADLAGRRRPRLPRHVRARRRRCDHGRLARAQRARRAVGGRAAGGLHRLPRPLRRRRPAGVQRRTHRRALLVHAGLERPRRRRLGGGLRVRAADRQHDALHGAAGRPRGRSGPQHARLCHHRGARAWRCAAQRHARVGFVA